MFFIFSCVKDQLNDYANGATGAANLHGQATSGEKSNGNAKVDLCHYDADNGTWHVINVSQNAVPAHLAHGDVILIDADGDGWVEAENECVPGGDCNDNDATVHPGAEEVCGNGVDDNCDGNVDEGCITGCWSEVYPDAFNISSATRYSQDGLNGNGCAGTDVWTYICFDFCNTGCTEFLFTYGFQESGVGFCAYATEEEGYVETSITFDEVLALDAELTGIATGLGLTDAEINCCYSCSCTGLKGGVKKVNPKSPVLAERGTSGQND